MMMGWYPIEETSKLVQHCSLGFNSNSPTLFVAHPHVQVFKEQRIVAPATGALLDASITFPLYTCCPKPLIANGKIKKMMLKNL
jgi:hypothetical protein